MRFGANALRLSSPITNHAPLLAYVLMGTAHVCATCGRSLARTRPLEDPRYGLMLVHCRGCGARWVRRRHPIQQRWRAALRVKRSVCALVAQLVLLVGLALGCMTAVHLLESSRSDLASRLWHEPLMMVNVGILLPMVTGLWLTVGLSHWRRPAAWGAWAALVACLLTVQSYADARVPPLVELLGVAVIPGSADVERWLRRLLTLGIVLAIAVSGVPVGRILLRVYARNRQLRFRKRRARQRAGLVGR